MKRRTIRVPLESWIYLANEGCRQRTGHEHTQKYIDRLAREYENRWKEKGKEIVDRDFGGATGDPVNSYEEGRWTTWTIKDIKEMLDAKGLYYKDGEEIEEISVIF